MSENIPSKRRLYSLKPVLILTVAAILISKAQRAATEDESVTKTELSMSGYAICPDYCNLPADRATKGKAPFRMWYYDSTEGGCQRFRWSGRGGNKNRFHKKADCEETCSKCTLSELMEDETAQESQKSDLLPDAICSPLIDEGRCDENQNQSLKPPQLMWHYNKEKAKCSPFIFYGCGGNSNRFENQKDCEETCH